jgi:hypothetical protein
MGILDDPSTCSGIANEWEPCSPTLFQSTDTLMYQLITDPQYLLPQNAPDGNYCPIPTGLKEGTYDSKIVVYPSPTNSAFTLCANVANFDRDIIIFNSLGKLVGKKVLQRFNNQIEIDLSYLGKGIYYVQIPGSLSNKILIN